MSVEVGEKVVGPGGVLRSLSIHVDPEGRGGLVYKPDNFRAIDVQRSDVLLVNRCSCASEVPAEQIEAFAALVRLSLTPPPEGTRMDHVRRGEPTVTKAEALGLLGVATTKFNELVNSGRVIQPLLIGNRNVWLRDEILAAKCAIIISDTAAGTRPAVTNRHIQAARAVEAPPEKKPKKRRR
jgi:hypothetical protein